MSKLIILSSCESVRPLKDGGWSIRFHTNEPNKSQIDSMLANHNQFGVLYFEGGKEELSNDISNELDSIDLDIYDKPKSQSQRLRNVLYRLWEQENDDMVEFKEYYRMKTEAIISHFKDKLEP